MMLNMASQLGSSLAGILFVWHVFQRFFPPNLQIFLENNLKQLSSLFYPYIEIKFHEHSSEGFKRNEAYGVIDSYLSSKSIEQTSKLKADVLKDGHSIVLSLDDYEEVSDEFDGIKLFWSKVKSTSSTQTASLYPGESEKRHYKLSFHKRYRDEITKKEARKKAEEEERLNAEADIEKDEPEDGKNGEEKGPTHREKASEEEEGT